MVDGGYLFDFAGDNEREEVQSVIVVVARDAGGDPLDLVAWAPRTDRLAARFGRAPILGEHCLAGPRVGAPPPVHQDFPAWLRAGRDGILIVHPGRAGRVLRDAPSLLLAADAAHARDLASMMSATLDLEKIVVPTKRSA